MKIPLSLIQSYLEIQEPLSDLAEVLTLLGIEVDGIQNATPRFSGVVVGKVLSATPHPEADRLRVAQVSDGNREWQVVCAAANCRAGLLTAFAKTGALLFDEEGKERRIGEAKLRGVESFGMLCSASELGLPGENEGILELPSDFFPGEDLSERLWDPVLELSLTPNLGHCMSALGIARELSASLQRPLREAKTGLKENSPVRIEKNFQAKILAPTLCQRYACRLIENVKIGPSPFWLQQTLLASGMRPINNAVDATNYILLKTGQPLHAFDAEEIKGHTLKIQTLNDSVPFQGLDGVEYTVPPDTLLICDEERPLALAGILGGVKSAVSEKTQSILLEAASFDPISVRKAAKCLGIRTDSSQRFEKGTDPQSLLEILDEAAQLIAEICGGSTASGHLDIEGRPLASRTILLRPARANALIGVNLSLGEIQELMRRIGCKVHAKQDLLHVEPPAYRNDLQEEIDLVEEVARLYGYNNIERKKPLATISDLPHDPLFVFEREIRRRMSSMGLQELLNCDLISPALAALSPELLYPTSSLIQVLHAKSEEYSILRPSLLPGMLETVRTNLDQKNSSLSAFEVGRIYLKEEHSFSEIPMLGIAVYGKERPHHWEKKPEEVDFYDLKGIVEALMESLGIPAEIVASRHASFHPGRQANLCLKEQLIGSMGEIHPAVLEKLDIKQRVLFAEINLSHLMHLRKTHHRMTPLPQYPATERDWTITLPKGMLCKQLFDAIHSFHSPLLEKAELIDLYLFEEEAKRNATLRFTYRDLLKTISFEEAEAAHAKLMAHVIGMLAIAQ